jgi:hypothetical protein
MRLDVEGCDKRQTFEVGPTKCAIDELTAFQLTADSQGPFFRDIRHAEITGFCRRLKEK